jgi:hypothetical protein
MHPANVSLAITPKTGAQSIYSQETCMGPRAFRPLLAVFPLLIAAAMLCCDHAHAQIFVVGEGTATADVVTEFHPTHVDLPTAPLDEKGHTTLIRDLMAEQGFAHRELPRSGGLTLIANGNMIPSDTQYKHLLYEKGQSAAPGERVEISALHFGSDRLIIDFNGGPYAKHRFLSHIQINNVQLAQEGPVAVGCRITLIFEGGFPAASAAQIKALLDPVVDFTAHSAAEAYTNTLSAKVREAVAAHRILVGMDRRMVLASVGEPHDKHREHTAAENESSPIYEEWIYGTSPEPTRFVRFRDDRVVRLEIAELGKPVEIHEIKETDDPSRRTLLSRSIQNGDAQPNPDNAAPPPPSLRRPGEVLDAPPGLRKVNVPDDPPATSPQQFLPSTH